MKKTCRKAGLLHLGGYLSKENALLLTSRRNHYSVEKREPAFGAGSLLGWKAVSHSAQRLVNPAQSLRRVGQSAKMGLDLERFGLNPAQPRGQTILKQTGGTMDDTICVRDHAADLEGYAGRSADSGHARAHFIPQ